MKDTFTFDLENSFDNLYKGGAFFTAGDSKKANTMTISWGSIGYMWRKPVFMAMIRESRYTSNFIELGKDFTISVPALENEHMKKALMICGSKSGRDIDKTKEANIKFIPSKTVNAPIVGGCDKYYECRIMLMQPIDYKNFNKDIKDAFYPDTETNHVFVFGEILKSY